MSKRWPRVGKLVKQFIGQAGREMDWKEAELLASAHCDDGWSLAGGMAGGIPRGQHWGQELFLT